MRRGLEAVRQRLAGTRRVPRLAWVYALAALPLLVFCVVSVLDRLEEQRSGRQQILGTATALAEHAGSVFTAIDIALAQVERSVGDRAVGEARGDRNLQLELQTILGRMPALESLFLVDESGVISASSRAFPMPPYDVQHRDYFQVARSGDDTLYVSVPFRGEFARSVAFTVSRRIISPDGTFRGLVAATVFPEYFHSLYRGVHLSSARANVTLLRPDGTEILRFPDTRPSNALSMPADFMPDALRRQSGLLDDEGRMGSSSDVMAFRVVPNTSLVLIYGTRRNDLLAPWYGRLAGYGSLTLALSALIALAGGYVLARRLRGAPHTAAQAPAAPVRVAEYQSRGAVQVLDAVRSCLGLLRRGSEDAAPLSPFMPKPHDLMEGAGHGLTLAQRLITPSARERAGAKIVSVRASIQALSQLLSGSFWPPLDISGTSPDDQLDIFVEPEAFDLALFELASALKQCLPGGAGLRVAAARETLRQPHPEGLSPGDYVVIAFEAGEVQAGDTSGDQQARLRFVARFAHRNEGALVMPPGEAVTSATLWIPCALLVRAPKD